LTGTVTNLGGFYWITHLLTDFAAMPLPVAAAVLLLLAMQQGLSFAGGFALGRWLEERRGTPAVAAYPLGFVLAETLNPMIFPWALGHSQASHLWLAQSAELGGATLISGLLVAINVALSDARRLRSERPIRRQWAIIAAVFVTLEVFGIWRVRSIDARAAAAPRLEVGVIEANIGVREKHNSRLLLNNNLIHQRMSAEVVSRGADLVVWPETMFSSRRVFQTPDDATSLEAARSAARVRPGLDRDAAWLPRSEAPLVEDVSEDARLGTPLADRAVPQRGFRAPLLTGVVTSRPLTAEEARVEPPGAGDEQVYNSAVLLDADGRVLGLADKNYLMPFSENLEIGRWMYKATGVDVFDWIQGLGDFAAGTEASVLELPRQGAAGARIGVMICYEDILPQFARRLARSAPNLLINVTNDAWFGKTSEPWLHLDLARFRSIEMRTALIRSTNTGVSALIDPVGRVVDQTSLDDAETLLLDVPLMTATRGPYMWLGEWPALVSILLLGWYWRRRAA
jgi:apolipoprotein N-acyltransferase